MPKHAAPEATQYLMPVYYLTDETLTKYPLALLLDHDTAFPTAYGVTLIDESPNGHYCYACRSGNVVALLEMDASGGGNPVFEEPICISCLVGGDHLGLIPTCYLTPVPFD